MYFYEELFIVLPVLILVIFVMLICWRCIYYYRADEETRARMRMRAEGTIPIFLFGPNRGETSPLMAGDIFYRPPPPAYNTMTVENETRSPPTSQK